MPSGSPVIRYVRDGQTDGWTDEQNQNLVPVSYGRGHNNDTTHQLTLYNTNIISRS